MRWFEPDHALHKSVAPDFNLTTPAGQAVTRSQFRQKQHLILVFLPAPGAMPTLLTELAPQQAELAQAGAVIYVVSPPGTEPADLPLPHLIDPGSAVRARYAALAPEQVGALSDESAFVMMLNRYGVLEYVGCDLAEDSATADDILARMWSVAYQCSL